MVLEDFLNMLSNNVTNGKQYLKVNEVNSETSKVTSRVSKELELLLFIIYINDLPRQVEHCEPFGYADDYKLVTTNPTKLQADIDRIEKWWKEHKMK